MKQGRMLLARSTSLRPLEWPAASPKSPSEPGALTSFLRPNCAAAGSSAARISDFSIIITCLASLLLKCTTSLMR